MLPGHIDDDKRPTSRILIEGKDLGLQEGLNQLGQEGWELVGIQPILVGGVTGDQLNPLRRQNFWEHSFVSRYLYVMGMQTGCHQYANTATWMPALNGVYANLYRMTFAQTEAAPGRNGDAVACDAGTPAEVTAGDKLRE